MKKVFLILLFSIQASAFTLLDFGGDPPFGWNENELIIYPNFNECTLPDSTMKTALDRAIALWNTVSGSAIKLTRGPDVSISPSSGYDGTSEKSAVIICSASFAAVTSKSAANIPATTISRMAANGHLEYGATILNAQSGAGANLSNFSDDKVAIILAHEIGHILGLGHTEEKASIMYFDVTAKTSLGLSKDDMDGINYLYSRHEIFGNGVFGCGSISGPNDPTSGIMQFCIFWILTFLIAATLKGRLKLARAFGP